MLIAIEGIDGSGKSTLAASLACELVARNHELRFIDKHLRRPVRAAYTELCRDSREFPSALASLFVALGDFAWTSDRHAAGAVGLVLWDRYVYSAFADAFALGIRPALLEQLLPLFPQSDVTILVSIAAWEARARKSSISLAEAGGPDFVKQHRSIEDAFDAFQDSVNAGYRYLAEHRALGKQVIVLDGRLSEAELNRRALQRLSNILSSTRQ